jgi:hypothetical protein
VRRRLAAVLAALTLMLGGTLAVHPAPSYADAAPMSWNACPSGELCFWEHTNYWGITAFYAVFGTNCYTVPNWISSTRNNTVSHFYLYKTNNCTGTNFDLYPGQSFSPMPSVIGDNGLRSFRE